LQELLCTRSRLNSELLGCGAGSLWRAPSQQSKQSRHLHGLQSCHSCTPVQLHEIGSLWAMKVARLNIPKLKCFPTQCFTSNTMRKTDAITECFRTRVRNACGRCLCELPMVCNCFGNSSHRKNSGSDWLLSIGLWPVKLQQGLHKFHSSGA